MTRRRRLPFVSRVCIGFLLFFSTINADTIKGPPTVLEKVPTTESGSILKGNRTILSKVPSAYVTDEFITSSETAEKKDPPSVGVDPDLQGLPRNLTKNGEANARKEKVQSLHDKEEEAKSQDQVEKSSTPDSVNGGPRLEEVVYGTSGKSSSTKAVSEDFYRLSRTNGLTTVTTKPGFEESRLEEKRNKETAHLNNEEAKDVEDSRNASTTKLDYKDVTKARDEKRDKTGKTEQLYSENKSNLGRANEKNGERDREATTPQNVPALRTQEKRRKTEDSGFKNSEVEDLEKVAEQNGNEEPISLINDTYVNYSHYYKTSTTKDFEVHTLNESRSSENGTNFISDDATVTQEKQDPKEEVEVVRNVTHSPIQKIVVEEEVPKNHTSAEKASERTNKFNNQDEVQEVDKKSDKRLHAANTTETSISASEPEGVGVNGKDDRKVESTRKIEHEEQSSTVQTNSSPVPRGRTIAFSAANEFPTLVTKSVAASTKEIDIPLLKNNISTDKIDQKPYPYVKSNKEVVIDSKAKRVNQEDTTEESSAYENTIGRGESEKKFIVTEPSVVIENSIQQFKPTYPEKTRNGSSNNSTTEAQSLASLTTASFTLQEVRPTNETFPEKSYTDLTAGGTEDKSKSTVENDVPRGNEGSKVITAKDENFDVTGNGITEVSLKPESTESAEKRPSYEVPLQTGTVNRTTKVPFIEVSTLRPEAETKMGSNVDIQTDAEESLLIRSTLNVTEVSTEYPLNKETSANSTTPVTTPAANFQTSSIEHITVIPLTITGNSTEEISTVNIPVESQTTDTNGTNEIPSGLAVITLQPDELPVTTTTSVEYEFVGLSDATVIPSDNVTEDNQEHTTSGIKETKTSTVPSVQDTTTKINFTEETNTVTNFESTTENSTSEREMTNPDETMSTIMTTEETMVPTTIPTTELNPATQPTTVENQTDQSFAKEDVEKTSISDSWSTTEENIVTVVDTENPLVTATTKDLISNDTETSIDTTTMKTTTTTITLPSTAIEMNSSSIPNVTTMMDTMKTSTSVPFVPSSLRPRIFVSSTWSTPTSPVDVPTPRTTDDVRTLSPDEITSVVRIVMKGTTHDVCPYLDTLKQTLADILRSGMNKSVYAKQIIFHQNPCLESPSPTPTPEDVPLTSILVYVVDEQGKFDKSMTNMLPTLYSSSSVNFPVPETDSGNAIAVVVVSSVAFICLILLAGLLFVMRKRQTRFNYGERCRPVSLDAYSLDSVSAYNSVRRKGAARSSKRSYGNPTFEDSSAIPSHPLNFAGLSTFCNDVNAINEEFSGIPQVSAKIDELPPGAEVKNRYANVIPLPETRVPLQKINNDPLTEYINASYVRGARNATRYYVACQGPMESTVTDFWRMIWEQQSKVIIMLTDLVENGVEKCSEYIPPSEVTDCHRLYGDFQVTLKKREPKEKYAISTLHLKNLENNTFREVYHIWYLWPVNGVQSDGAGLIAVLLEGRALQRGGPGPIVVHCSPGTGRTGTLIALDLGIRQYEITRTVDVPRVVYTIRRDRAGAVQTKEQYAFIYKALNLYATKLAGGVLEST